MAVDEGGKILRFPFVDQVRANHRGDITGTTEPRVKEPPTN